MSDLVFWHSPFCRCSIKSIPRVYFIESNHEKPLGRNVLLGENNYGKPRLFDGFQERRRNQFTSLELQVILERENDLLMQSWIEMVNEAFAGVFAFEAQEDVLFPGTRPTRERSSVLQLGGGGGGHCSAARKTNWLRIDLSSMRSNRGQRTPLQWM